MKIACASPYLIHYLYLLQFLSSMSYNFPSTSLLSLIRLITRYFMLFVTIVKGIVFLISLSVSSLLAYKNATDFWILILYPAALLNSFISSSNFLVESLGSSMYSIMLSANKDSFTSFFTFWVPFISSSCLIAGARTSSTMLNEKGEVDIPVLFLILRGTQRHYFWEYM